MYKCEGAICKGCEALIYRVNQCGTRFLLDEIYGEKEAWRIEKFVRRHEKWFASIVNLRGEFEDVTVCTLVRMGCLVKQDGGEWVAIQGVKI